MPSGNNENRAQEGKSAECRSNHTKLTVQTDSTILTEARDMGVSIKMLIYLI